MKTQHSEKRNSFWESKYRWLLAKAALMLLILMGTSAWAQDFVVEGAGSTDANGTYVEYSTLDGVPAYRKEGGAQTWYLYRCWGEYWFIEPYTSCEGMNYYFFNFSDTPPETGWSGWPEPAPTVAPAGRSLAYASTVFNESAANDGAIENSLIITYNEFDGDALTGDLHDDFVALNKVAVANVPIGLTPQLIKTDANELTFSLTGNALNHEQSDSVFDITLEFLDAAFVGGDASGVSNYQLSNISLLNVVTFSGGSGTAIDPFLIGNKLDLQILSENWSDENLWAKHYKQMANITFVAADFEAGGAFYNGGAGWTPIGSNSAPFSGSYNGDGHTIANLFINRDEGEQGFFGRLADGSEITNVGLIDIDFTVRSNSGGLVGFANDGSSIANSYTTGTLTSSGNSAGGLVGNSGGVIADSHSAVNISSSSSSGEVGVLVGTAESGTITNSYATGNVVGVSSAGGLVGRIRSATIANSFATGEVTCTFRDCGGFAGLVTGNGRIESSYALGNVIRSAGTSDRFGGFVGWNAQGKILNSYSTGSVSFDAVVQPDKGFAGDATAGGNYEMTGNFWDTETSGASSTAGIATSRTSAEMKTQATFTAVAWDFTDTTGDWAINSTDNDGYPYLQWQTFVETFTVSYNANGAEGGSVPANQAKIEDVTLTLAGNSGNLVRTGFTFDGWNTASDGTGTSFAAGAEYAANAAVILYAHWTANEYTLSFNSAGGTAVANITQDFGTAITAPADPTRSGFTFAGWDPAVPATMPLDGLALTAQWTANEYTLSFDSAGGTAVASITQAFGSDITAPADPTRSGFTFAGWDPAVPATMPVDGLALTAQWTANEYILSFDSAGGSAVANITQDFGTAITAPADPTRSGFTFAGWDPAVPATMPVDGLAMTAQWTANEYTLSFDSAGGSAVANITQDFGTAITAPADPTRSGFTFAGWDLAVPATMPVDGLALTAQWTTNEYILSFDSAGGSAVANITQDFGTAVTAPADPTRSGFTFAGWDPAVPATMPVDGLALTAQWTANEYTLSFDSAGGAAVASITQAFGSDITAPSSPTREGFTFAGWSPALPATMPINGLSLTAEWTANDYTLSFDSDGGSAVASLTQSFGTNITAPTNPTREGYTFSGWSPSVPTTMPSSDLTVVAQWTVNAFTLTFDSAGGSEVSPINQDFGAPVDVTGPSRAGYTFTGWSPALPETMPATNETFTAQWTPNQYTLTFDAGEGTVDPESSTVTFGTAVGELPTPTLIDGWFKEWNTAVDGSGDVWTSATDYSVAGPVTLYAHFFTVLEPELPEVTEVASEEPIEFRVAPVTDGSEIDVLGIERMRGGATEPLTEDEIASVLTQDGSDFTLVAAQTGRYVIQVQDTVSQQIIDLTFDVLPYIAFSSQGQAANLGQSYTVAVTLSDLPIDYPVAFSIETAGLSANPGSDIVINDDTNKTVILLELDGESDAEIRLLQSGINGALFGSPNKHQLRYQVGVVPLNARVVGRVNGNPGLVAQKNDLFELTAVTSALGVSYAWSAVGHNTSISNANGEVATIDTSSLEPGLYSFRVVIADASSGRSGEAQAVLRIVAQCPIADCGQTGSSGIPQSVNVLADKPQRLMLCPQTGGNKSRISQCSENDETASLEAPTGYEIRLGQRAADRSWESGQFASALESSDIAKDIFTPISFMVDFAVTGLSSPSESVPVTVPMPFGTVIPEGAVWRKYIDGRWVTFFENEANAIHSAPRNAIGACPSVLSDAWQSGLIAGHECVRLTIEDGGPNDADGLADGVITDPGVLAIATRDTVKVSSRGGSLSWGVVLVLGLVLLLGRYRRSGRRWPQSLAAAPIAMGLVLGGMSLVEPVYASGESVQSVESRVLDENGVGLSGVRLVAEPEDSALPTLYSTTDDEGVFRLDLIRGVTYRITASRENEDGTVSRSPSAVSYTPPLLSSEQVSSELNSREVERGLAWRPKWYLGAQGYWMQTNVSASDIQKKMNDDGIDGEASLDRSGRPGGRLFAGLWLHDYFSIELAWLEWASLGVEIDQALLSLEAEDLRDALPVSGRGAELSVLGHYPVWNDVSVYGRLGWMAMLHEIELAFSDGSKSEDERWVNALSLGGGISYQWREQIGFRLGGDWYNTPNYSSFGVGLGMNYSFN